MTGYYIYEDIYGKDDGKYPGVIKKIKGQISVLSQCFDIEEIQIKSQKYKILKRIPFGSFIYKWHDVEKQIKDAKFIYVRKPMIDAGFVNLLKNIKANNSNVIVLLEIPTFPYDHEQFHKSLSSYPFFLKEINNRKKLKGLVDRIVIYARTEEIFNIPTICIQNGIDIDRIPLAYPNKSNEEKEKIVLVAVASLQPSHGYERILEGLRLYYTSKERRIVEFLIVGSGEVENDLKRLVKKYGLTNYVKFFGQKVGKELDKVYEKADIALGCFGLYKRGIFLSSALKTRDYIARGMPVVSGCMEDVFSLNTSEFYLEFPNDNTPIDINTIIIFYDKLLERYSVKDIRLNIRKYAEDNVSMSHTFSPVCDFIKDF